MHITQPPNGAINIASIDSEGPAQLARVNALATKHPPRSIIIFARLGEDNPTTTPHVQHLRAVV